MQLQREILNLLSQEQSMLCAIMQTTYRTEGKVDSLRERVNRIEDREQLRETTGHREPGVRSRLPCVGRAFEAAWGNSGGLSLFLGHDWLQTCGA